MPKFLLQYINWYIRSSLSIYNKLITLETNNIDIYNNIGLILQSEKNYKEAEKIFRKAYTIDPYNSKTYLSLLTTLKTLNKIDEVITECKKLIKLNPNDVNLLNILGNTYKDLSKFDDAELIFIAFL